MNDVSEGPLTADSPRTEPAESGRREPGSVLVLVCLLLAVGLARLLVVELFYVPSGSMSPTLQAGDHVLAEKLSYRFVEPRQGDLVVFQGPDGLAIKRVVGLPGDRVAVRDGVLFVNGDSRREAYVDYRLTDSSFFGPEVVPEGRVFVMGDNRSNSRDSRSYGAVPEEDLLGRTLLRVWPPDRFGSL